jgi:glycosyltransferase involved in cell wall biosynthesis
MRVTKLSPAQGRRGAEPAVLWAGKNDLPPHRYLVASCRRAGETIRELHWDQPLNGERFLGREITLGGRRSGREHPVTVRVISLRLLAEFVRAPEDVIVCYEFGLVGLYAGLSKILRPRRRVVVLVEGDYGHLGRTGTASVKVALRRFAARHMDAFVANNEPAKNYLVGTLKVPEQRIVSGWWLAGMPPGPKGRVPPNAPTVPEGIPRFICAGRLIQPKGFDLLIRAVAAYRREFGPCALWILGDGPEKASLAELARRLEVDDAVAFLGTVDHEGLKGALDACDVFVFPTLRDLTGRVAVEALSAGVPVVVSPMAGAAGTIVQDGVNGIVVDPRDTHALAEALHRAADPQTSRTLRAGVQRMNASLTPDAAAEAILRAVALARRRPTASTSGGGPRPP